MSDYTAGKPWKVAKQQHIMEVAFQLFAERGIEQVAMPEVAEASGVARATLYRYFATKLDLVVAVGTWKWTDYVEARNATLPTSELKRMSGAQYLKFYLDAFIDLYRNHSDILRFNYDFNSYLRHEEGTAEQRQSYIDMAAELSAAFHEVYERGAADGTIDTEMSEESMFSSSFHIMLAAATRYAVGLVHVAEGADPDGELVMLEQLLLSRYVSS